MHSLALNCKTSGLTELMTQLLVSCAGIAKRMEDFYLLNVISCHILETSGVVSASSILATSISLMLSYVHKPIHTITGNTEYPYVVALGSGSIPASPSLLPIPACVYNS